MMFDYSTSLGQPIYIYKRDNGDQRGGLPWMRPLNPHVHQLKILTYQSARATYRRMADTKRHAFEIPHESDY